MPFDPQKFAAFKAQSGVGKKPGFDAPTSEEFKRSGRVQQPGALQQAASEIIPSLLKPSAAPMLFSAVKAARPLAKAGFAGVKKLREESEEIGPRLAGRGVPPF